MDPDVQLGRSALGGRLNLTAVALACSLVALICATFLLVRHSQLVRETTTQQTRLAGFQQLRQFVDHLLGGVYAGRSEELSFDATLGPLATGPLTVQKESQVIRRPEATMSWPVARSVPVLIPV